jgi:hypothetical protein
LDVVAHLASSTSAGRGASSARSASRIEAGLFALAPDEFAAQERMPVPRLLRQPEFSVAEVAG